MPLAFLGQYEIHKCLSKQDYAAVYEAVDGAGEKVVVKFLFDPDSFFDEMARHYAVDDCQHVCKLIENFPPYDVTGDPFMFRLGLASLFDMDHFSDRIITPEEMKLSPLADMGALVLSYVEGMPLVDLLAEMDERQALLKLVDLCRAVLSLHEFGECHGDLIGPNVIVEEKTGMVKLLDLGYFTGKHLPSGQYRAPHCERDEDPKPHDDVYMLGRNFMALVPCSSLQFTQLREKCIKERASDRPKLIDVLHQLEALVGIEVTPMPVRSRRRLVSPALAAAALFVFTLMGSMFMLLRMSPTEARPLTAEEIRSSQMLLSQDRVRDGAQVLLPDRADFVSPIAVFAHAEQPVLVGREHVYRLGDQVFIDGRKCTIAAIDFQQLVVEHDKHVAGFRFQQPGYMTQALENESGWLVWENSRNLPRLLDASASLLEGWQSLDDLALTGLLSRHRGQLKVTADTVYGFYPGASAQHFLLLMEQQLDIRRKGGGWHVALREDMPSLHLTFKHFLVEDVTVKGFCDYLSRCTGLIVESPPHLRDLLLPRTLLLDISWQGILDAMNFEWYLSKDEKGSRVTIRSMNI